MRFLRNALYILGLVLLLGIGGWLSRDWWTAPTTFSGETHISNISTGGDGSSFSVGDTLLVQHFIKSEDLNQDTLIQLQKKYNQQFGLKEGTLKVDGVPVTTDTVTIPAQGNPVKVSYEVIANGSTGNPATIIQPVQQPSNTPTKPSTTENTDPVQLSGCPAGTIVHNSDQMLVLQGTALHNMQSISIEQLNLSPNKQQGETVWFNLPGRILPDGAHTITINTTSGTTIASDCSLETKVYTSPIATNSTPSTLQSNQAQRILVQGEVLDKTTTAELRGPTTVPLSVEILDNKVLSLVTPTTLAAGTYTLWLSDGNQSNTALGAPLLVRDTN